MFIGAATGGGRDEPYGPYLEGLKHNGMRAEMARLTLARKIAAVALAVWKKGEAFDPKEVKIEVHKKRATITITVPRDILDRLLAQLAPPATR